MNKKKSYNSILFIFISIGLVILFILNIKTGYIQISLKDLILILSGKITDDKIYEILYSIRIPRAITAVIAGITLAVSGMQMQTVFRNPLAGPFVLGISSGASLGVSIIILFLASSFSFSNISLMSNWLLALASSLGSFGILFVILIVSLRVRDNTTLLVLGLMFSSATSAIVGILQYVSNESLLKSFIIWSLGSLSNVTVSQIYVLIPCLLTGLFISVLTIKPMNALLMGENYASSVGIKVKQVRVFIFISTGILAGSVTAFCGPIGFIGIAVPHISRIIFNSADHKTLLLSNILIGGSVLLLSDILSKLPGNQILIPINSVTSLIGIPIVVWVIFKNKKISI